INSIASTKPRIASGRLHKRATPTQSESFKPLRQGGAWQRPRAISIIRLKTLCGPFERTHHHEELHMRRREFITLLGGAAAAWPRVAGTQQAARAPAMAMFHPAIPPALLTETGGGSAWRAFFGELRRLGYVEGQSLIIERYSAEGHHERYEGIAREIVIRSPDVIVTGTNPVVTAFNAATKTIPVVA